MRTLKVGLGSASVALIRALIYFSAMIFTASFSITLGPFWIQPWRAHPPFVVVHPFIIFSVIFFIFGIREVITALNLSLIKSPRLHNVLGIILNRSPATSATMNMSISQSIDVDLYRSGIIPYRETESPTSSK